MSQKNFPLLEKCNAQNCLYGAISFSARKLAAIYRKHLRTAGLSNSQFGLMMIIAKRGPLWQKDLVEFMAFEKSTVSRNLKILEKAKLLKNLPNRSWEISVKGKRVLNNAVPHWERANKECQEILESAGEKSILTLRKKLKSQNL